MKIKGQILRGEYFDSVTLMRVGQALTEINGVDDAAMVMGTKENRAILETSGLLISEFDKTNDTDLLVAIKAEDDSVIKHAFQNVRELLDDAKASKSDGEKFVPKSLEGAMQVMPGANLALISVAGRFAGSLAEEALRLGMHVMIFSDNVPVETERELKEIAHENNLLVMGPDCGTAILNGIPLAFANVVRKGDIGIVAASGTGLQEVSCIIHNEGCGISQGIGTGGRDVKEKVGGIMLIDGLRALNEDPETAIIDLVSKPPDNSVMNAIRDVVVKEINKPVIATFLGQDPERIREMGMLPAETLEENALLAVSLSQGLSESQFRNRLEKRNEEIRAMAIEQVNGKTPEQNTCGVCSVEEPCAASLILFIATGWRKYMEILLSTQNLN